MNPRLEAILSTILTVCAVLIAATLVHRQFLGSPASVIPQEPTEVANWEEVLRNGVRVGAADAPVQVVAFGDFECPWCRMFHFGLKEIMADMPNTVALVHYHFPLRGHRWAEPAARAAECTRSETRFGAMMDVLYAQQDSFGLKSWAALASAAGVADTVAFNNCLSSGQGEAVVAEHVRLGEAMSVIGTPTVMINGWRLNPTPPPGLLREQVKRAASGLPPGTGSDD